MLSESCLYGDVDSGRGSSEKVGRWALVDGDLGSGLLPPQF